MSDEEAPRELIILDDGTDVDLALFIAETLDRLDALEHKLRNYEDE